MGRIAVGGRSLRVAQEESLVGTDASGEVNSARRSAVRFQGRNCAMSCGARPLVAAQFSRYQQSQRRGFRFHCFSVATIENMAAVRQTLQTAPDPKKFFRPIDGPRTIRSEALLSIGIFASSTNNVRPDQ